VEDPEDDTWEIISHSRALQRLWGALFPVCGLIAAVLSVLVCVTGSWQQYLVGPLSSGACWLCWGFTVSLTLSFVFLAAWIYRRAVNEAIDRSVPGKSGGPIPEIRDEDIWQACGRTERMLRDVARVLAVTGILVCFYYSAGIAHDLLLALRGGDAW